MAGVMSQNLLEQEHRAAQMKEPLEQCGRPLPAEAQPAAVLHPTDGALETLTALVVGYGGGQGVDRLLYTYDAENRLTGVSPATPQPGNARVLYTYDYLGRRVRKVSQARQSDGSWLTVADRLFIYDGWRLLCEQGTYQGNAFRRRYTWGLDLSRTLAGAGGIGGLLAVSDGPTTPADYVYCYDGNGNVGQVLDLAPTTWNASAVMVARYEYDPYGRVLSQAGTYADPAGNGNPFQFSTKYYDHEVGLIYFGYRYYSPRLGRWINRDPIGERGGVNDYVFVKNWTVQSVDALGLKTYVIEGTNAGPGNPLGACNAQRFGEDDPEGAFVQAGPGPGPLGYFSRGVVFGYGLADRVENTVSQICSDMCSNAPPQQVNIVGWSRGAVGALMVVDYLAKDGCCCQWQTEKMLAGYLDIAGVPAIPLVMDRKTCCDRRFPTINFLGLYDPVDMTPRAHPASIPPIVQNCALAIGDQPRSKTAWCTYFGASPRRRSVFFPLAKCEPACWDRTKFRRRYFDATHGGIGTERAADDWMRKCARQAGVNIPEHGPTPVPRLQQGSCTGDGTP